MKIEEAIKNTLEVAKMLEKLSDVRDRLKAMEIFFVHSHEYHYARMVEYILNTIEE